MQALLQTEHESLKAVDFLVLLNPGDMNEILEVIFKQILVLDGLRICNEIGLRGLSLDLSDDKWTLVQAMAWCRQATSHYLNQCRPSYITPYGVTRPRWVKNSSMSKTKLSKAMKLEQLVLDCRIFIFNALEIPQY